MNSLYQLLQSGGVQNTLKLTYMHNFKKSLRVIPLPPVNRGGEGRKDETGGDDRGV